VARNVRSCRSTIVFSFKPCAVCTVAGTVALSDHVPRPGVAAAVSRSDRLDEFVERGPDAEARGGLKTDRTAGVVIAGHAFMQNIRRGHYELGAYAEPRLRVAAAFDELRQAI
jgi:hypothetical protein